MRLIPPAQPFLEATVSQTAAAGVVILGAPLDLTECWQSGTSAAPTRVRVASDVLESYSPALDADLTDMPLADWGDVDLNQLDMEASLEAIADVVERACTVALPVLVGGEHTATLGAVRGVLRRYPNLVVLHIDAHTDLRDEYLGLGMSHATVMRRVADEVGLSRLAQYGIRSGTREEFDLARRCLFSGPDLDVNRTTRDRIHRRPVYVTIDIDVLDPSVAPGTGCPEPGGATYKELAAFLLSLRGLNVVAVDVMEILPAVDTNDITSVAGAKLVREAALAFGRRVPPR